MYKGRFLYMLIVSSLLLGVLSFSPATTQVAQAQPQPPGTVIYNLYATDGFVTLADGTQQYIYGFIGGRAGSSIKWLDKNNALQPLAPYALPDPTGGPIQPAEQPLAGNAQFPAPIIYATTNDVVEIRLKNLGVTVPSAPNDPHTIHLHGLDVNAANDGVPETSVAAVPANAKKTIGAGNVVVYMFAPSHAGTYMYHCHQEASIHVQMGMYGALVIYNPTDAAAATGPGSGLGGNLHGWAYTKDTVLLLSEFDIGQHQAEYKGGPFNPVNYKPQYWFINGLSFPNTAHAGLGFNWGNWIAAHPGYDPFIVGSVGQTVPDGDRVLLRVINMGFEAQPMHMHGFHAKIIGSDQRAWPWANDPNLPTPSGQGMEKNTLLIGSGETYEWLIDFSQQSLNSTYATSVQTRYYDPAMGSCAADWQAAHPGMPVPALNSPVENTLVNCPAIPDPFAPGFAYVGGPVVGPDGSQGGGLPPELPVVAGQFFPFHNHDDYKATNNGVYPGGMFTMILTTP
jgi:FtsP/CotA-like multicopper oxidase with cupredoxin domain